jgi:hypothetical protein
LLLLLLQLLCNDCEAPLCFGYKTGFAFVSVFVRGPQNRLSFFSFFFLLSAPLVALLGMVLLLLLLLSLLLVWFFSAYRAAESTLPNPQICLL